MTRLEHVCGIGQCLGFAILAAIAVMGAVQEPLPKPEVLSKAGNTTRGQTWAEAVDACEKHGGAAVPRATKVLGRSADLPACVPQLGTEP